MRIVIASNNQGKINEFKQIFGALGIDIVTLKELCLDVDVVEDADTFEGNALKKAREICEVTGEAALSDDSGLEVDYLNGEPGVYSARYAGYEESDLKDAKNNEKLLKKLEGVPEESRTGRFVSAIAVVLPDGKEIVSRGECEGTILTELHGEGGFGYDPLFYYPPFEKTFAEMTKEEKNGISHRGRALQKIAEKLKEIVEA